jgi:hypothetical protein
MLFFTAETNASTDNKTQAVFSLHCGSSRRALVRVLPCGPLYRIAWPDIGLSQPANLARCQSAAREWAERNLMTDRHKMSGARRLKSLNNFWWSSSYVAPIAAGVSP